MIKNPTSAQMRRYTTVWNIGSRALSFKRPLFSD